MYNRVSAFLDGQGVHTICTRTEDTKPNLTERAGVSNRAGATCFVSIHSNAAGNGGWYDASGLEVITSAGPMTAQRNILATDLVNAFHAAGVALRSTPIIHDDELTVLVKTDAPAVLIEYGFHTNKGDVALLKESAYRDRLAEATARGICKWLGVSWKDESQDESQTPWYAEAQEWAVKNGISDGTRPNDTCTRAEVWSMLMRLTGAGK